MFQIKNSALSVRVDSVGAQLTGLYSPATDMEYLWQPGYETWPHSSMLLFPNPGRRTGSLSAVRSTLPLCMVLPTTCPLTA